MKYFKRKLQELGKKKKKIISCFCPEYKLVSFPTREPGTKPPSNRNVIADEAS